MSPELLEILEGAARGTGTVVTLTGAGISAESGIPTFRGKDGYWVAGSRHYHPHELATLEVFRRAPEIVWPWYLYRRAVCRAAAPNPGHLALARLEQALGERFVLVTQNVDGLHLRAGNSPARTLQIHGNIQHMRCFEDCVLGKLYDVPAVFDGWTRESVLTRELRSLLLCPDCGARSRPHVLWFDESYDEQRYRARSAAAAAAAADLLLVVGTAGETSLPMHMVHVAASNGAPIVDINPDDNPFARTALATQGFAARGTAGALLPPIVEHLIGFAAGQRGPGRS